MSTLSPSASPSTASPTFVAYVIPNGNEVLNSFNIYFTLFVLTVLLYLLVLRPRKSVQAWWLRCAAAREADVRCVSEVA